MHSLGPPSVRRYGNTIIADQVVYEVDGRAIGSNTATAHNAAFKLAAIPEVQMHSSKSGTGTYCIVKYFTLHCHRAGIRRACRRSICLPGKRGKGQNDRGRQIIIFNEHEISL
jgi:hypothetical protein